MRKKSIPLRFAQLETYVSLINHLSYTEAAKAEGISQSSATRHVQALETWTHRLLLTDDVPPEVTDDGWALFELAIEILDKIYAFRADLSKGTPYTPTVRAADIVIDQSTLRSSEA